MNRKPALSRWYRAAALAAAVAAASWVGGEQNNGSAAPGAGGATRHEPVAPTTTVRLAGPATPTAELAGSYALMLQKRAMARESVDLFESRSWKPPPAAVERAPEPPPRVPELPFAYVGRLVEHGESTVFLEAEDRLHAVKAGQTVDGRYRVDEIHDDTVSLTYLPLGARQTLQLRALTDTVNPADAASAAAPAMGRRSRQARLDAVPVAVQPGPEPGQTSATH